MADSYRWLFDPSATRRLVLAHRDADDPAVRCVVSDVVWSDVVVLLRWARASTSGAAALLRAPEPVPLRALATEVDALGDAAIAALVAPATGPAGAR